MNTTILSVGILLVLLAMTFGLWFYPGLIIMLMAMLLLGGYLSGQDTG